MLYTEIIGLPGFCKSSHIITIMKNQSTTKVTKFRDTHIVQNFGGENLANWMSFTNILFH